MSRGIDLEGKGGFGDFGGTQRHPGFRMAVLSETAGARGYGLSLNVLHRRVETDLSPSVWRARDRFEPRNIRGGGAASEGRAVERRLALVTSQVGRTAGRNPAVPLAGRQPERAS